MVRVYWNLHRRCWSVQARTSKKGWRVWRHETHLVLLDCTPLVSEAGRQRVLATRKKQVHAYLLGQPYFGHRRHEGEPVSYNPFEGPGFRYLRDGSPFTGAGEVRLAVVDRRASVLVAPTQPVGE